MAELNTELRPGSIKTIDCRATIGSYVMIDAPLPVSSWYGQSSMRVNQLPNGSGSLDVVYARALEVDVLVNRASLHVERRNELEQPARGFCMIPSYLFDDEATLPYMDNSPRYTESSEAPKISEVDFVLGCTFDSAINFQMDTEDGIRAVLDDDDKVIESSSNTYAVDGLRLGKLTKRTLITHTDFRLNLVMKPTIVKADPSK